MSLTFCDFCNNLMKQSFEDQKQILECYSCGNIKKENNILLHVESKVNNDYNITLNMKYDRTLPRTLKYKCKNPECPSQSSMENPEIIYFSKNNNLSKGYMCTQCDACWL